jgi:hypothetical protein
VAHDPTQDDTQDDRVDGVILAYLQEVDAGRAPDRRAWLARYPDLAAELQSFFDDNDRARSLVLGPSSRTPGTQELPPPVGGYRPLRLLGAGGMGRVYEAEDPSGRRVALKLLAPHAAGAPTAVERFRQEGRLAGRISHPRCVFVFKADAEAGQPYIAMELMSGTTLKDLIERDGPLPAAEAVARTLDIIEGLAEAHRAGVIHRDVKPANCYVEPDGRVKVGDFGLSRSLTMNLQLTRAGGFVGTPLFASPEQLRGEPLDVRTDVYSVAATLYYLLTGRAPFEGADGATLVARVVSEPAPPPRALRPDLPPALEAVVLRGLERQRERRFQDLDELRAALLPLLPGQLTIAGVGLRLGAYCLDALLFMPFGMAVGFWAAAGGVLPPLPVYLMLVLSTAFYHWLGDGLWGGALGKRLVGLRVWRATGCEPSGLGRALVRTVVFVGMAGLVVNLLLYAFLDRHERVVWVSLESAGSALGLLVCFSTMRARNGYRGLHELASGTRVVQLPVAPRPAGAAVAPVADRDGTEPTRLPAGVPPQVGPYLVRRPLRWDGAERLLLAEDPSLERPVWLRFRPRAAGPLPAARQELARATRLRWLAEGVWGDWHWDAFVAPSGERLADLVARQGVLTWPAARSLLEQLADELQAAVGDGTLPAVLSPERVWAQPTGRVQLLDGPEGGGPAAAEERSLALLRQVVALALEGRTPPADAAPRAPRATVPLHARALLRRLAGEGAPYGRLAEVQADLVATRARPVAVTPVLRGLQLALASLFLVIGLAHTVLWGRLGPVLIVLHLDQQLLRQEALRFALADEETRQALLPRLGGDVDPAALSALLERRHAETGQELETWIRRLGVAGWFSQVIPPVLARMACGADEPLRCEYLPGEAPAVRVTRLDLSGEEPAVFRLDGLARAAGTIGKPWDDQVPGNARPVLIGGAVLVSIYPALWVAWAFGFRGGLSLRLAGLALVRPGGADARRLQCALRALLVWLPVSVLLWLGFWADVCRPALPVLCDLSQGAALLLLLVYLVLALRSPGRGPHDWLAGTHLVPR